MRNRLGFACGINRLFVSRENVFQICGEPIALEGGERFKECGGLGQEVGFRQAWRAQIAESLTAFRREARSRRAFRLAVPVKQKHSESQQPESSEHRSGE